jgi:hypothetical protein
MACAGYVLALVAGYGVCYAWAGQGTTKDLSGELADMTAKTQEARSTAERLHRQIVTAQSRLEADRAVGNQPDWSILLSSIAADLKDDIVLRQCRLSPINDRPGSAASSAGRAFVFQMEGYGRSQDAVSEFVLRLERKGLFDEVKLVRTSREPLLSEIAINFRLDCAMGRGGREKK